ATNDRGHSAGRSYAGIHRADHTGDWIDLRTDARDAGVESHTRGRVGRGRAREQRRAPTSVGPRGPGRGRSRAVAGAADWRRVDVPQFRTSPGAEPRLRAGTPR